jgi:electron transport complex protein RnfD
MKEFHLEPGPYVKNNNSTNKMMFHLLIALLPIIAFSFIKNGVIPFTNDKTGIIGLFYPLIFIGVSTLTTFLCEMLYVKFFLRKEKQELKDYLRHSFSIFPGLFLALVLPINTPLSILIFGGIVATLIGKMLFGGFGNNIFNPALIGCLFVVAMYSATIATNGGYLNSHEIDAVTSATPLSNVSLVEGIGSYDTLVKPYGNLWNFFIGTIPGAVGETSALLCLLGFIYLSINKVIKWRIPLIYILTVFGMTYMIGSFNGLGVWYPLFQIMSGGLMLGAIFMATDPVTSPTTPIGQVLYGLFLGILTVVFRYLTPYPEGVLTAILTMNMFVFIIDRIGYKSRFNFNKSVIPFVISWILILGLGSYIGNRYLNVPDTKDPNYEIIDVKTDNQLATYTVTQKGFSGKIKAKIVIDNGIIKTFEILEQHDSYFQKLIDANYMNKIINEQNNLKDVDTVSGATISSNAIKKMAINTMEDYEEKIYEK